MPAKSSRIKKLPYLFNAFEQTRPSDESPPVTVSLFSLELIKQVLVTGRDDHGWDEVGLDNIWQDATSKEACCFSSIVLQGLRFECWTYVTASQPWDGTIWRVVIGLHSVPDSSNTLEDLPAAEVVLTPLDTWDPSLIVDQLNTSALQHITH